MTRRFADDAQRVRRVLQTIALRKVGRPHDMAMAILFLASSRLSGHMSGEILTVSGGMEGRVLYQQDEIDPNQA
jgi:3-oxoacyl-[acyl-carrier protein] reductase